MPGRSDQVQRQFNPTRTHVVHRLRRQIESQAFPRIQMGLIVGLTGGFGLLSSFLLLRTGIESMALRYPLALGIAYLFFLFLLWLWLRSKAEDYADLADIAGSMPSPGKSGSAPQLISGGGGDFGGGGASASFDAGQADIAAVPAVKEFSDVANAVSDADEFAIPLMAILVTVGLAFASLYIVYLAPSLFAELLFDGALSYTLYRRLRGIDSKHWLGTAVRRTILPFGMTALFLCAVGAAMAAYAPGARSIGDVLHFKSAK